MGLEIVEMIMRVEEEFDIEIFDEEATYIETVGQLHLCVLDKIGLLKPSRCPSSATFYQLRRALVDLSVAPRGAVAPATSIGELLPATQRRQTWKRWGEAAGVKLPELEKPKWMSRALWFTFAAAMCFGPIVWVSSTALVVSYYATVIALCFLLHKWSELHAVHLPIRCESVGGVTKAVMKLNYGINVQPGENRSHEEVWQKLKAILVDELGVEPNEITPEVHFVRDLQLG